MRHPQALLALPLLIALSACGGGSADTGSRGNGGSGSATPMDIPATTETDGWLVYASPIEVKQSDMPGGGSPEAAAAHFYASLMRGDDKHKDVILPGSKADRVNRALEEYSSWKFTQFKLLKKKEKGDEVEILIEMQIEIDGDTDGGEDELTVEKIDGKWYVTKPPR